MVQWKRVAYALAGTALLTFLVAVLLLIIRPTPGCGEQLRCIRGVLEILKLVILGLFVVSIASLGGAAGAIWASRGQQPPKKSARTHTPDGKPVISVSTQRPRRPT